LEDLDRVPAFWPDVDSVRHDMLDYAYEIEYFDLHLGKMIKTLEELGELENTIIVVTSDNGMPFPKAKGNAYLYSHHLPLAIMWPVGIKNPGRVIEDYISFIDFAPTFLELAQIDPAEAEMPDMEGKSFTDLFYTDKEGRVDAKRNAVIIGQERHDVGRPNDVGYPIRGIITDDYIYLHNFETDRWPAGNPQTGYLNTDGSPTKTVVLNSRREEGMRHFWEGSFGKRPQEELYLVREDRECMQNLALHAEHQDKKDNLKRLLFDELKRQEDPRMFGKGHVFDEYPYAQSDMRNFYERYMQGEKLEPGWVNPSDFEPEFR
jgi:N-sulfoglucosamine sulfohydrolase